MNKKALEQALETEIRTCCVLTTNEDGESVHANHMQENGTYQDGLIFALQLLRKK